MSDDIRRVVFNPIPAAEPEKRRARSARAKPKTDAASIRARAATLRRSLAGTCRPAVPRAAAPLTPIAAARSSVSPVLVPDPPQSAFNPMIVLRDQQRRHTIRSQYHRAMQKNTQTHTGGATTSAAPSRTFRIRPMPALPRQMPVGQPIPPVPLPMPAVQPITPRAVFIPPLEPVGSSPADADEGVADDSPSIACNPAEPPKARASSIYIPPLLTPEELEQRRRIRQTTLLLKQLEMTNMEQQLQREETQRSGRETRASTARRKKTIKKTYQTGLVGSKVGVLLDNETANIRIDFAQAPMHEVRKRLIEQNFISATTSAPQELLRDMYADLNMIRGTVVNDNINLQWANWNASPV